MPQYSTRSFPGPCPTEYCPVCHVKMRVWARGDAAIKNGRRWVCPNAEAELVKDARGYPQVPADAFHAQGPHVWTPVELADPAVVAAILAAPPSLTKRCFKCDRVLPLTEFRLHPGRKDGLGCLCHDCMRIRNRNRMRRLACQGQVAEVEQLKVWQRGLCAICGQPETSVDSRHGCLRELSADHDHGTGELRGLLCYRCNVAISWFGDKPTALRKALAYLKNPPAKQIAETMRPSA